MDEKSYLPELSYMFKHALTHDVAYSTLLHECCKSLHRIVPATIEELYSDRLSAEHYETLAHHYYEGQEWDKKMDFLMKSAHKPALANKDVSRAARSSPQAIWTTFHSRPLPTSTAGEPRYAFL